MRRTPLLLAALVFVPVIADAQVVCTKEASGSAYWVDDPGGKCKSQYQNYVYTCSDGKSYKGTDATGCRRCIGEEDQLNSLSEDEGCGSELE